jgi:hypothetical protein
MDQKLIAVLLVVVFYLSILGAWYVDSFVNGEV